MRAGLLALLVATALLAGCVGSDDGADGSVEPTADDTDTGGDGDRDRDGAGAAGPGESARAAGSSGPNVTRHRWNLTVQSVGANGLVYACVPDACSNLRDFTLASNASALVFEAAWTASTPAYLDPMAPEDDEICEPPTPAGVLERCEDPDGVHGSSPLSTTLSGDPWISLTGDWSVVAFADRAPQPTEVTVAVTVVHDDTAPEDAMVLQ